MLPELGVIFDAGTGMFRARDLIQTKELDIFLSHIHLDHCVGLTFLYDVLWEKEVERVTVHVAKDKIESIETALYHPDLFPVKPNFELRPLVEQLELSPDYRLTSHPLAHPGGCHGFRLEGPDLSLAYVTDTIADPTADYVSWLGGVDTLVHECYFPDGWEDRAEMTGHSCLSPVAQVAKQCSANTLYLVHINPLNESEQPLDLKSVDSIFQPIVVASDQLIIDV